MADYKGIAFEVESVRGSYLSTDAPLDIISADAFNNYNPPDVRAETYVNCQHCNQPTDRFEPCPYCGGAPAQLDEPVEAEYQVDETFREYVKTGAADLYEEGGYIVPDEFAKSIVEAGNASIEAQEAMGRLKISEELLKDAVVDYKIYPAMIPDKGFWWMGTAEEHFERPRSSPQLQDGTLFGRIRRRLGL